MTGAIETEIAALVSLDNQALRQRWTTTFGKPPPKGIGPALMLRTLAYDVQCNAMGGLSRKVRRQLVQAGEQMAAGQSVSPVPTSPKAGTRLIREWQGVTHEVILLEKGVEYRGRIWSSLSAVAREITGARWSGPRFFGLNG
tara:strand:- start:1372 stop:1797 length:426 start_codon:yes stop_codon:yes gene_type:complete